MGRKAELGHVLVKLFVINLRHVVPLTCLTSHRRIRLPWPLTALTERYCIRCGPTAPVLPGCVPMSAIKFRSSFQNLFIKEDMAPDAVPIQWMGRKAELGHVLESKKTTVGVSAFTERYCIK
jgi:hypothetical protein